MVNMLHQRSTVYKQKMKIIEEKDLNTKRDTGETSLFAIREYKKEKKSSGEAEEVDERLVAAKKVTGVYITIKTGFMIQTGTRDERQEFKQSNPVYLLVWPWSFCCRCLKPVCRKRFSGRQQRFARAGDFCGPILNCWRRDQAIQSIVWCVCVLCSWGTE
ncbi:Protein of unknown function [Cotesia congregata]|uniref:Uncharacterized protein n=1 Tax=Cotesia congregata TaxID=51543 RepID=A0A8J2MTR3_COTCN|nr:Protein of unknown function [Cotesia congregata]